MAMKVLVYKHSIYVLFFFLSGFEPRTKCSFEVHVLLNANYESHSGDGSDGRGGGVAAAK